MALSTYAQYIIDANNPDDIIHHAKLTPTLIAGRMFSAWTQIPWQGLIPSTSAATDRNTTGALNGFQNTNTSQYINHLNLMLGANWGTVILIDRLAHQGGLSGIVLNQATNLPTAALTRYTGSYVGVMAAAEVYTAIGATGVFISGSYTNQAGLAGRTFSSANFGATGFNTAGRFIILPLAAGDTGVRSVQSISISATTGTAGNFGITLFKPIAIWAVPNNIPQPMAFDAILSSNGMQLEQIQNNACLQFLFYCGTTTAVTMMAELNTIEI
jgi:hypothetical protein